MVFLILVLVTSNLWWMFQLFDAGVTATYMGHSLEANKKALSQTIKILPIVADRNADREQIISAARLADDTSEPFEKDGLIWVGMIGLKFDKQDKLISVERAWRPP